MLNRRTIKKSLWFLIPILSTLKKALNAGGEIRRRKLYRYAQRANKQKLQKYSLKRKTIALVVPCFKHADFLPTALKSILNQTVSPDEIIFVNDASDDSTQDILEKFKKSHSKLNINIILNSENLGQAHSLNKGISLAESDLIMILNDDDYLMHNAIEMGISLMQKHTDIHLSGFYNEVFHKDTDIINHEKIAKLDYIDFIIKNPKDIYQYKKYNDINLTQSSSIFTKYAWDIVGGFYSKKSQRVVPFSDRDFQLRLNCYFSIGIFPNIKMVFWREGSSVDNGLNS